MQGMSLKACPAQSHVRYPGEGERVDLQLNFTILGQKPSLRSDFNKAAFSREVSRVSARKA